MAEFPVTKPEFIVPSCVNLSTYIQGMSDYEVRCYYSQLVQQWATEWAQMQTQWSSQQQAFEDFKTYVNNKLQTFQDWFNNLDVQTEINNKIDEMVSNGEFLEIIQTTVNSQTQSATDAWLEENMTPGAGAPALDSSLTLENAAAQAKATGDAIAKCIRASNVVLSPSNYTSYFTDANDAPKNQIFYILKEITPSQIANLPSYGEGAVFYTVGYSATNPHGFVQYYIDVTTSMCWMRAEFGSAERFVFSDWVQLTTRNDLRNATEPALKASSVVLNLTNYTSYFTDANDAPKNQIFYILKEITPSQIANLPSYGEGAVFYTVGYSATNPHGFVQYYIDVTTSMCWMRAEFGSAERFVFSDWVQLTTRNSLEENHVSRNTVSIFQKVVCCGDSYTSGHIDLGSGAIGTNENYAWPHYLSLLTGNEYINCGKGGANVLTWQTDPRGLPAAKTAGKAQAYIVGLGLNDTAEGTSRYVPLGTSDDIGTEAQTYYGQLSKIIRELNAISPLAKIFVQTMPNPSVIRQQYNEAIRTIVSSYKDTYPVFLLDLTQYNELYTIPSIIGDYISGHYTAIGYQQFAEILKIAISDCINNNIKDFQNVYLIPTE